MIRLFVVTLVLLSLLANAFPAVAQNPFISKDSQHKVSPPPGPPHPFLVKIAAWQHRLNQKMASLTRQARETGSLRPLLFLVIIAFSYGVLHAAGPGHGKAVAMSYLISHGKKLGGAIIFGNLIALFHSLSAVGLVLTLHFVLRKGVTGTLENVTRMTQLISYSLIALMGAVMLTRSLFTWLRQSVSEKSDFTRCSEKRQRGPLAMALVVGMVPCPGVVLVLLFSLSLNMLGIGLLLAFFQTLGMAVTISGVTIGGVAGKNLALGTMKNQRKLAEITERITETAAALMVTALGLLFLAATV